MNNIIQPVLNVVQSPIYLYKIVRFKSKVIECMFKMSHLTLAKLKFISFLIIFGMIKRGTKFFESVNIQPRHQNATKCLVPRASRFMSNDCSRIT